MTEQISKYKCSATKDIKHFCLSLSQVTTVTLEDLPGCSLSTLAQCARLQSLTLRRCGLKSLEGISQLQELCYIDVQVNMHPNGVSVLQLRLSLI